jgi:hypothetical protein
VRSVPSVTRTRYAANVAPEKFTTIEDCGSKIVVPEGELHVPVPRGRYV